MRLLVVGHSYVTAFNQMKYAIMKRLHPALQLKIISPRAARDMYRRYEHEVAPGLNAEEAVCLRDFFFKSHMTYLLDPIRFIKILMEFKPDYIHIEEDPHSLISFETVCLTSMCCPKTPISFFIWDNLARVAPFPLNALKRWLTFFALSRAACVVAGNHEAQQLLGSRKNYHGPSFLLPQFGIDCAAYQGAPKPEIVQRVNKQPGVPVIGYMGRLISEKGILLLCEALSGLEQTAWKLVIVGAGPLENILQEHWKPKFGERLLLVGPGARTDLPDYLKCMDVLVVPSVSTPVWKEQFGMVLIESMAAGVPVIGSTSGAIPEVIGEAGILVPEGDIQSLREALARLLGSEQERKRLSQLGQARALGSFSHESVSNSYMNIFNQFSLN